MRALIVNDLSDNVRIMNNLLASMYVRPALTADERETPLRILIVDNKQEDIQALSQILQNEGMQVTISTSGKRALRIAELYPPDLVLLDVLIPEMDGFEVLNALKSDPLLRAVPVIFLTDLDDEASEIRALEMGAVDYLSKPLHETIVKLRIKIHLELKLQREILENLSRLDGLTRIPNRRAFEERFDQEWRRAQRTQSCVGIAYIDLDLFKKYNDLNGHLAGDECLQKVATALHEALNRAGDFLSRYDGKRFCALFPGADAGEMNANCERLRSAVETLKIPHDGSPVSPWITASLGAAMTYPSATMQPSLIFSKAQQALLFAKGHGRNQVCLSDN